jgi:hypothetical protein
VGGNVIVAHSTVRTLERSGGVTAAAFHDDPGRTAAGPAVCGRSNNRADSNSRGVREVARRPLHHADHHGDFIVVTDADLGMGIVGGAAGAQESGVLLKLGQGRAAGESSLVLACIFVLRSHGHHLCGMERAHEGARLTRGTSQSLTGVASCAPRPRMGRAKRPDKGSDAYLPQCQDLVQSGNLTGGFSRAARLFSVQLGYSGTNSARTRRLPGRAMPHRPR